MGSCPHNVVREFPMKRLLLLLLPVALFAGQARYARLGQFEGKVEVQLHPNDP